MNWYKIAQQNIQISLSELQKLIEMKNPLFVSNYLYLAITTNSRTNNKVQEIMYSQDPKIRQQDQIYRNFAAKANVNTGQWAQWNIQKNLPQNSGNFKLYYTPNDDDWQKVLNGLNDLVQILNPISIQFKSNLSFKIPSMLAGYYKNNDRLVIHFSNKNAHQAIQQSILQWSRQMGIGFGQRTHALGQDANDGSYGERIANQLGNLAIQYFNSNKWNSKQIAQWIITYLPNVLKDIKNN